MEKNGAARNKWFLSMTLSWSQTFPSLAPVTAPVTTGGEALRAGLSCFPAASATLVPPGLLPGLSVSWRRSRLLPERQDGHLLVFLPWGTPSPECGVNPVPHFS